MIEDFELSKFELSRFYCILILVCTQFLELSGRSEKQRKSLARNCACGWFYIVDTCLVKCRSKVDIISILVALGYSLPDVRFHGQCTSCKSLSLYWICRLFGVNRHFWLGRFCISPWTWTAMIRKCLFWYLVVVIDQNWEMLEAPALKTILPYLVHVRIRVNSCISSYGRSTKAEIIVFSVRLILSIRFTQGWNDAFAFRVLLFRSIKWIILGIPLVLAFTSCFHDVRSPGAHGRSTFHLCIVFWKPYFELL